MFRRLGCSCRSWLRCFCATHSAEFQVDFVQLVFFIPWIECLEDWDVAVDLGSVFLRHAFSDPGDVPILLFLQLDVRVEHSEVELVHERLLHQQHLEWNTRLL